MLSTFLFYRYFPLIILEFSFDSTSNVGWLLWDSNDVWTIVLRKSPERMNEVFQFSSGLQLIYNIGLSIFYLTSTFLPL